MLRELAMMQYMSSMAKGVGLTCDMGVEGRSELNIGNGWVEHERPDGKKFYVNNDTKKRTWQRPSGEGILEEGEMQRCQPVVTKMKYSGRYPMGVETSVNDGYDCDGFLNRLYSMNEGKWERDAAGAAPPAKAAGSAAGAGFSLPAEEKYVPAGGAPAAGSKDAA